MAALFLLFSPKHHTPGQGIVVSDDKKGLVLTSSSVTKSARNARSASVWPRPVLAIETSSS